jgi:leader peptidase (prepilin peptidase) / N-methyltransferase
LVINPTRKYLRKWWSEYWIVALAILAVAAVAIASLDRRDAAFAIAFGALALLVAKVDLDRFEIPDLANLAIFILGLAWIATRSSNVGGDLPDAFLRALAAGVFLWAVRAIYGLVRKIEGLGWGDVKLAAAGAVWLLWPQMPAALLLAAVAGIVAAAVQGWRAREIPSGQMAIPFGTVLAPSIWLVWFGGLIGIP